MERTIEEAIERVKRAYELVTGHPAPEASAEAPYARIPPEVDREEYVVKQAAALFERVRAISPENAARTEGQAKVPAETCWVLPLPGVPKDNISVEFNEGLLKVRVTPPGQNDRSTNKVEVR